MLECAVEDVGEDYKKIHWCTVQLVIDQMTGEGHVDSHSVDQQERQLLVRIVDSNLQPKHPGRFHNGEL